MNPERLLTLALASVREKVATRHKYHIEIGALIG
jgi:hypothetical protein